MLHAQCRWWQAVSSGVRPLLSCEHELSQQQQQQQQQR
jgi:hypothetical protein